MSNERFTAYVYDVETDSLVWREYTRETLLDEIAVSAIHSLYAPMRNAYRPINIIATGSDISWISRDFSIKVATERRIRARCSLNGRSVIHMALIGT